MSQPNPPYENPYAPAPVLTGETFVSAAEGWAAAPSGVRDARTLALFGGGLGVFMVVGCLFLGANDLRSVSGTAKLGLVFGVLAVVHFFLAYSIKKGASGAWLAQLIISCLGLLSFPIGTLVGALILLKWFKPETKAWFGRV